MALLKKKLSPAGLDRFTARVNSVKGLYFRVHCEQLQKLSQPKNKTGRRSCLEIVMVCIRGR